MLQDVGAEETCCELEVLFSLGEMHLIQHVLKGQLQIHLLRFWLGLCAFLHGRGGPIWSFPSRARSEERQYRLS